MTAETSNARELVAKLAAHVRPTCSELWAEAQAFLAAEGAQSGEVSAYDLAVLDDAAETLDRIGEGSAGLREARARIASALSQQPEARGGGEVVAWMTPGGDVSRSFYWCLERCLPGQEPQPLYAAPQQPAAPSGEAGAFDANFLQSVASLCRAAYDLCQPKPQRTPEDPREHYGELCLLELTSIADEIERRLAAAEGVQTEESRSVTNQLLHWGGIPVHVTGTVTTSPGNWPLIDATLTGERNG